MKAINTIKSLLLLVLIAWTFGLNAQQQSQYTQFMNVGMVYNPAFAGINDHLNATLLGRWQWVGFEGAPNTQTAVVDTGIRGKNIGLGVLFSRDEIAVTNFNRVMLNYAYHIATWNGKLSMGVSGSFSRFSTELSDVLVVDPDATFNTNQSSTRPNFGFGVNFRNESLQFGLSIPEVINNKLEADGVELFRQQRHIYLTGSYKYPINDNFDLQLNTLFRYVAGSPFAADLNVMGWYQDRMALGLGHRLDESINAIVQVRVNDKITAGYAYDFVSNEQLSNLANASHEVMVSYATPWSSGGRKTKDQDNDGIRDKDDECPTKAGPVDNMGCPLPDTDGDGVPDESDKCPLTKGSPTQMGCPDRDGDGVIDREDKCPDVPGTADQQGCADKDGDGILDQDDACPEVFGAAVFNGCPDSDGDGVADSKDACPNEAGRKDNGGCPGLSDATKEVLDQALEGVQFESSKDVLKESSFAVLNDVVQLLKDNPEYKMKISGYTDSSGGEDANLQLSDKRAQRVKTYLVENGIDGDRLEAKGFGEVNPIADNNTSEGRKKNRRVELEIR